MSAPRHHIAVCAIIYNEAPYLLEWVAFHLAVGVEHFFIYDNDSDDGTSELLDSLAASGCVTRIPWSTAASRVLDPMHGPQITAYRDFIRFRDRCTWAAFIDADEFIVPLADGSLPKLLARFPEAEAVCVNWRIFGSAGEQEMTDRLVLERFPWRAIDAFPPNRHVKSIVRMDALDYATTHVSVTTNRRLVDVDGQAVDTMGWGLHSRVASAVAQINHYFVKSAEEWARKLARGKADQPVDAPRRLRDPKEFAYHDCNDVLDLAAYRFLPETLRQMARLGGNKGATTLLPGGLRIHPGAAGARYELDANQTSFIRGLVHPVAPARLVDLVLATGFDVLAYLQQNQDLVDLGCDETYALFHFIWFGVREGRAVAGTIQPRALTGLLGLQPDDRDYLRLLGRRLIDAAINDADFAETCWTGAGPVWHRLPDCRSFVVIGDSQAAAYVGRVESAATDLLPVHLACPGQSASFLMDGAVPSAAGARILARVAGLLPANQGSECSGIFLKFGDIDLTFLAYDELLRSGRQHFADGGFAAFVARAISAYEAFLLQLRRHAGAVQLRVCSVFPPTGRDDAWHLRQFGCYAELPAGFADHEALWQAVRKLALPSLAERTARHLAWNAALRAMCLRNEIAFVDDFSPVLGADGLAGQDFLALHDSLEPALDFHRLCETINALIRRYAQW